MDPIRLHVAGATVRHNSPFNEIEVPVIDQVDGALIKEWVVPLYMDLGAEHTIPLLKKNWSKVDEALIGELLSYFDWRPRSTAAYLAALRGLDSFDDHIGRLLVRSDLCYAGDQYCLALAEFNTPLSISYLQSYLRYYLSRPDLWFNQWAAMGALGYLDAKNGTSHLTEQIPAWNEFIRTKGKGQWDLDRLIQSFDDNINALHQIRALFDHH